MTDVPKDRAQKKQPHNLEETLGKEFTDEELCFRVRNEWPYHSRAWNLLIERKVSLEHFKLIARSSLLYQPIACKYILGHSSGKDDLLFVATKHSPHTFDAAKKLVANFVLTEDEMRAILKALSNEPRILFFCCILRYSRENIAPLEMCVPQLYENYSEQLRKHGVLDSQMQEYGLRVILQSQSRNARFVAAKKLLTSFPSHTNFVSVCKALKTEETEHLSELIAKQYVTRHGFNWRKISAILPEQPSLLVKEYIEALTSVHRRSQSLRALLRHANGFRKYAAATILNSNEISRDDIDLILEYAPQQYHKKVIPLLLQREHVRTARLIVAWLIAYELRAQIEQKIFKRPIDENVMAYMKQHAPDLLVRYRKTVTHQSCTPKKSTI